MIMEVKVHIDLDINNEINKLNRIVNNKEIELLDDYKLSHCVRDQSMKNAYLLYVLELTRKHPKIETYLKQLLENFSVTELNNFYKYGFTILHSMMRRRLNISLNSFEIIINFGIDVNSQTNLKSTPLHYILSELSEHTQNIIGLFVRYGADLNILNYENSTVLDRITNNKLNKNLQIIIMTLIDFGAKTNEPHLRTDVLEFIESYRLSNIKPAIKK